MARTVTLGTLVTRCQRRADLENQSNPSALEWKEMIHLVYGELYGLLADAGISLFDEEDTITTDGVDGVYPLPTDHFATIGVDYVVDTAGRRRQLVELMVQERNWASGVSGASEAIGYRLSNTDIILYPNPTAGKTYKHVYVPQPADLSAANDATLLEMATPAGEQFVIWGVSALAKHKVGMDNRTDREEREAARTDVEYWAAQRSLHTGRRRVILDDLSELEGLPGDWRYGW